MPFLIAKCIAVPLLLALVSWAQQRWGNRLGGFLAGLPISAGPISFFLALEQGVPYARLAAFGTLQSLIGFTGFAAGFIICARFRSWPACLAAALAAWFAAVALLHWAAIPDGAVFGLALLSLGSNALLVKASAEAVPAAAAVMPRWNILVRAGAALGLLLVVTMTAHALDPAWSGILAGFPIVWSILCSFTYAQSGRAAVVQMLGGGNWGMIGTIAFFAVIGWLPAGSLSLLYGAAILAALGAGFISSHIRRHWRAECRRAGI